MTKHEYYEPWRFTTRLGSGIDRTAYYSAYYNLVMKRSHNYGDDNQSANEKKVWDAMTARERAVFPVVKFFKDNGQWCIIMPRITTFKSKGIMFGDDILYNPYRLKDYCSQVGANPYNIDLIIEVRRKFSLWDLHCANLGWLENGDLVIIDMGL